MGSSERAAAKESPRRAVLWLFTSARAQRGPPNGSRLSLALAVRGAEESEAAEPESAPKPQPQPQREPWTEQPAASGAREAARTQAAQPGAQVSGRGLRGGDCGT